jgi:ABC-2 type transport system ATP-binding protein
MGSPEECKAGMGEELLEVEVAPQMEAAEIARAVPGVTGVTIYGHTLRIFAKSAEALAPALAEALAARGLTVQSIRSTAPTLEDVFMTLTRDVPDADRTG